MTCLHTTCDHCSQPLRLPVEALLLVAGQDTGDAVAWLVCPTCDDLVPLAVPAPVATSVVHAGCHVVAFPVAVPYPEQRPEGQRLSADDALALHELLADEAALRSALARLAGARGQRP